MGLPKGNGPRSSLPLPWVRHLKGVEQKDKFEASIRASVTALSRLYDLLEEQERDIINQESSLDDFSNTDWPYKQSFRNGQKSQIRELKKLLAFVKE